METMKAVRIHKFGGPEVLQYEDAPRPEPSEGEALVRVAAAGVNPFDWKVRSGLIRWVSFKLPLIPGWDLSGTIEALGPNTGGHSVGDQVFTRADIERDGAYAEYIIVRATDLARKPRSLDHVQAAAVPTAGLSAWQALFDASNLGLSRGKTVLIHGAAGGVGSFAVQLAKAKGLKVIATGSTQSEGTLRELGINQFVDYSKQAFEEVVHGVDGVLDTIGGETQARSWGVLKRGGVLASLVGAPSEAEARAHGARAAAVEGRMSLPQLTEITQLIDSKTVRPIVSEVMPLSEARRAHELSESHHVHGKIVLKVIA